MKMNKMKKMLSATEIAGTKHSMVKFCKKLRNPSFRKKEGKMLLEGVNPVEEAFKVNSEIEAVFFSESFLESERYSVLLYSLFSSCYGNTRFFKVSDRVPNSIAQTKNPQGILAITSFPRYNLEDCIRSNPRPLIMVVDALQDPGNLGTIIRTAAGAGLDCLLALPGSVDFSNPKVVRASAGALFRLPVFNVEDESELLLLLKKMNISLVGTDPHEGTIYYKADYTKPTAFFIGNENFGLGPFWRKVLDYYIRIPLFNTESLNAAVAAGVIIFEALRQRSFIHN